MRPGSTHKAVQAVTTPATLGARAWWRADLGKTLNSGNVSALADQTGNGFNLTQATSADQPLWTASDSDYSNKASIGPFNNTSTASLLASTASDWTFLSNGAGCTVYAKFNTQSIFAGTLLDTTNGVSTNVGMVWTYSSPSTTLIIQVGRGGLGSFEIDITGLAHATTYRIILTLIHGGSPDGAAYINGSLFGTANFSVAPVSTTPASPLAIGNQYPGGSSQWRKTFREIAMFNSVLSAPQIAALDAYGAAN